MVQEKKDETFRVVDKRLFTPEGVLRQDVADEQDREQDRSRALEAAKAQAAAKPPTSASPLASGAGAHPAAGAGIGPGMTGSLGAPGIPTAPGQEIAGNPAGEVSGPPPSRGFQMIVDVLARNAELMLGGIPDPRTGQTYMDLEGAREMIDMLDALTEKTRGNLGREDEDLLRDVTGALKLTFMQLSKAAADAMRAKTSANSPSRQ